MRRIGFAVVEWNQASGRPELVDGTFTYEHEEAVGWARDFNDDARTRGRGEKHAPCLIMVEDHAPESFMKEVD